MWSGAGERRIFLNTRWRLIAIDAATGAVIESFGEDGEVDLTEHLQWATNRLHFTQTSPPVVWDDLVILGNGLWDGFVYERDPPGHVLAFDVHSGELRWRFASSSLPWAHRATTTTGATAKATICSPSRWW
jgi:quinoprotein glucose dehydrogenase